MKNVHRLTLLIWICVPYLLLTFGGNKGSRYSVPILPAMAVISAYGIDFFFKHYFKKIVLSIIFIIGTIQFISISFGIIQLPEIRINTNIDIGGYTYIPLFTNTDYFDYDVAYNPTKQDWKIAKLFAIIDEDWKARKIASSPDILLVVNHSVYNVNTMRYCSFILKKDFEFDEVSYFNALLVKKYKYSYIIYKDRGNSCCWWDSKSISEAYSFIEKNLSGFECIYQDRLPDGSTLYCYKRIS